MGKKTDKLKDGLKNLKNKEIIIAAIAVAIMLIVYFVGGSGRSQTAKNDEVTGSDYRTETEAKLRDAIVKGERTRIADSIFYDRNPEVDDENAHRRSGRQADSVEGNLSQSRRGGSSRKGRRRSENKARYNKCGGCDNADAAGKRSGLRCKKIN